MFNRSREAKAIPSPSAVRLANGGTSSKRGKSKSKLLLCSLPLLVPAAIYALSVMKADDDLFELLNVDGGSSQVLRGSNPVAEQLSPFFSTKPLTKSLHPKYKLWTEMSSEEQDTAMEFVGQYIKKYANIINPPGKRNLQSVKQGQCIFDEVIGSHGHTLCGPKPEKPCDFISFGINDDPKWDTEVATQWGCRGFAADPTVDHPSKIHPNVTFHNIGATMLMNNEERIINKGGEGDWWMTSFPKLRYFLELEKIDILKIDCEGCEISMARDILREDPRFLFHVDQISIETHVTQTWIATREHLYYFGLMFPLLEEAGFKMEWSSIFGCSKRHEIAGCFPDLIKYEWPCGYKPNPSHPNVVIGKSCQEFTWMRYKTNE